MSRIISFPARYSAVPIDLARLILGAVQSSKMVHATLLLLMLEAVFTDLVSPSA
jgi:hypothetical protein